MKSIISIKSIALSRIPVTLQTGIHPPSAPPTFPVLSGYRPGWGRGSLGRANRRGLDARRRLKNPVRMVNSSFFILHSSFNNPVPNTNQLKTNN